MNIKKMIVISYLQSHRMPIPGLKNRFSCKNEPKYEKLLKKTYVK